MQPQAFSIRYSRRAGLWCLAGWVVLMWPTAALFYGWRATGKYGVHDWLIVGLLALILLCSALRYLTTSLTYTGDALVYKTWFLVRRRLRMDQPLRTEEYIRHVVRQQVRMLKLTDVDGVTARVAVHAFSSADLPALAELVRPFILYTDLPSAEAAEALAAHQQSAGRTVGKAFLYVLLPCLVIAALIIAWAILTKQPAFQH